MSWVNPALICCLCFMVRQMQQLSHDIFFTQFFKLKRSFLCVEQLFDCHTHCDCDSCSLKYKQWKILFNIKKNFKATLTQMQFQINMVSIGLETASKLTVSKCLVHRTFQSSFKCFCCVRFTIFQIGLLLSSLSVFKFMQFCSFRPHNQ